MGQLASSFDEPSAKPVGLSGFVSRISRDEANAYGWMALLAISAGLCSAAGTAAVAPLLHWLTRSLDSPLELDWHLLLLLPLLLRPLVSVAHAGAAIKLVARVIENQPVRPRLLSTVIILTRDPPLILLLLGATIWAGGRDGVFACALILAGLPFALFVDRRKHGEEASPVTRRLARARREAATDLPMILLIVALVLARISGHVPDIAGAANAALCVLLIRAPIRRLARVLG